MKILKATKDGSIGICPSYPKPGNDLGIYSEASWYRFYVGRDNLSDPDAPPYKLYAYKKIQGNSPQGMAVQVLASPYGSEGNLFYMRLRFDNSKIYFEYSTNNGSTWNALYQEAFALPGYSLNNAFHAEIAATDNSLNNGILKADDFEVVSSSATPMIAKIILDDPLNNATFVNRKDDSNLEPGFKVMRWDEGSDMDFSAAGWKPNPATPAADGDLVYYDLGRYIEKGVLEVDVTQFQPQFQNSQNPNIVRHHVLAMFRMPWGGHHVVENLETIWDFHTGSEPQFGNGVKLYSHTYDYQDELQTYVTNGTSPWNKALSYHLTIFWEANQIRYLRDGVPLVNHPIINAFNNEMQLRYAYVGRDRTACSGSYITGFMRNQYPTMRDADGPIYSNLVIQELVSVVDVTPPSIYIIVPVDEYANGARIYFAVLENDRNVAYYVEYGTTSTNLDSRTQVLGPTFDINYESSALLTNLSPNTTYYCRVVGQDQAGNVGRSNLKIFTTLQDGLYIFQPVADTYIEDNDTNAPWLYGDTRAYGNYGWMNLMTSERRDCFLQFNVGADVQQGTVAWGDYDNDSDLDLLLTGQLSNGTARISKVYRNDLLANGTRKFVDIAAPLTGVYYGSAAWGDYDSDGDLDILLTGNMNASGSAGRITKIYRNNMNIPNTPPSVPTNLSHPYSAVDNTYTLTWDKPTDAQTQQAALTYNVMIGTSLVGTDILSPVSHKTTGKRFIPAAGNAGTKNSYILNAAGLANGTKYYWKVQAIDNVFAGSAFSSPDSFIVGAAKTNSFADTDSIAVAQQAIPQEFALSPNYPNYSAEESFCQLKFLLFLQRSNL